MPHKDPEKRRANDAVYRAANRDKFRKASQKWAAANREKVRANSRKHYALNRDKVNARTRVWQTKNPSKVRASGRRSRGCPEPLRPAPAVCECCGKAPTGHGMCLDHCHVSGTFRGWLCGRCNRSIGQLGDSIDGLMNAVRYLERAAEVKK